MKAMFWDICCEILFELILEGAIAGAASKKVPMIARILLVGLILFFYGGLLFVIFHIAVKDKSITAAIIGVLLAVIIVMAVWKKYREYKAKKENEANEL